MADTVVAQPSVINIRLKCSFILNFFSNYFSHFTPKPMAALYSELLVFTLVSLVTAHPHKLNTNTPSRNAPTYIKKDFLPSIALKPFLINSKIFHFHWPAHKNYNPIGLSRTTQELYARFFSISKPKAGIGIVLSNSNSKGGAR